ncbi:MAG: hypothetical protein K2G85_07070 [Muribaculaceae bacterium]|nr:hypothetical protein [Muribaculaceae bacterium]
MNFSRYISFLLILLSVIFTSCRDELLYDVTEIGEGEGDLNVKVEFHSLEPALDTRSAGNAVDKVEKLWIVIYTVKADGSEAGLYEKVRIYDEEAGYTLSGSDFNIDQKGNSDVPIDAESVTPSDNKNVGASDGTISGTDENTPSATFKLTHIPYGRYKMFAVANVDLTDVDCTTIDDLRGKRFDWQSDVSLDNQMFGYVTMTSPSSAETSAGFEAPLLVVNQSSVSLHSWIKRLVSKVTVSFDASELKDNVRVYIKSITIHDIPASCALGESNKPDNADQLIKDGESFTYYKTGEESYANHDKWSIVLSKGEPFGGATEHKESDNSLYFYENMQGDYPGMASKDKRQDPDAVGTPIDNPSDGEDYKDSELFGTYIEVVAYYDSRHKDKISQGPIRYRFMLGKNSTYNYNAERNYHYKLTLKLRGWANEADWHISFKEYTPTLITPEPYYISYLYDQEMKFPARVILPEEWDKSKYYVKAEIVENNWVPWDRELNNGKGGTPAQFVGPQTDENGFAWNTGSLNVYEQVTYTKTKDFNVYQGGNYVGFLSLKPNTADIIGTDEEVEHETGGLDTNGYGDHANAYLKWYYENYDLAVNEYSLNGANSSYDQIDKSVHVTIPMYTRNKEMVPSTDFTGNNPFKSYYRYARVRFTLWQKTDSGDKQIDFKNEEGEWETERLATIYQVPRIENPTAIYRDANNAEAFEIKLMTLPTADATDFETFKSDGPWKAYVDCETENFIELYDRNGQKLDTVRGVTDEDIVFKYKPSGVIGDNRTRSGVIKVEYHDYNCFHLIFVRQGYHVGVKLGNATWSCFNVYSTARGGTNPDRNNFAPSDETEVPVALTKNPLSVGSLLKRNQYNYSIREENIKDGYGWLKSITGVQLKTTYIDANNNVNNSRTANWNQIQGYGWVNYGATQERYSKHWADTWKAVGGFRNNEEFAVPTAENYKSLLANCKFGYGIVYADGATTTQSNFKIATGFTDYDNDGKDDENSARGIRACIAYDNNDGKNIIFPLGSLGQARRPRTAPWGPDNTIPDPGVGTLSYSGLRGVLSTPPVNRNRPYTYNNYRNTGGVYWIYQPITISGTKDNNLKLPWADYASWDINYITLVFNPYDSNSLGGWKDKDQYQATSAPASSDALPIKLIYKN